MRGTVLSELYYRFYSGAPNESLADVFGIMIKQWAEGSPQTVDQANWLIGEGLWGSSVNGIALRDMRNPGKVYNDPQPAHWDDFKKLPFENDRGGVHMNSGIPSRAFYLAATLIGGYAWLIWYRALTSDKLRKDATFKQFVDFTIKLCWGTC